MPVEFLDARLRSLRLIRLSGTQLAQLDRARAEPKQFHWFIYAMILQARTTVAIRRSRFRFPVFRGSQFGLAWNRSGFL